MVVPAIPTCVSLADYDEWQADAYGMTEIRTDRGYSGTIDRPLRSLSIFCFHGAMVEIDWIVFS